jgi:hypothetical protein
MSTRTSIGSESSPLSLALALLSLPFCEESVNRFWAANTLSFNRFQQICLNEGPKRSIPREASQRPLQRHRCGEQATSTVTSRQAPPPSDLLESGDGDVRSRIRRWTTATNLERVASGHSSVTESGDLVINLDDGFGMFSIGSKRSNDIKCF